MFFAYCLPITVSCTSDFAVASRLWSSEKLNDVRNWHSFFLCWKRSAGQCYLGCERTEHQNCSLAPAIWQPLCDPLSYPHVVVFVHVYALCVCACTVYPPCVCNVFKHNRVGEDISLWVMNTWYLLLLLLLRNHKWMVTLGLPAVNADSYELVYRCIMA